MGEITRLLRWAYSRSLHDETIVSYHRQTITMLIEKICHDRDHNCKKLNGVYEA